MERWQIILVVANILSTSYLGAMEFFEGNTLGDSYYPKLFAEFTVKNRPALAICFGILTGFLSTVIIFLQPNLTRKAFRDSLMDGIFEQILDNDKTKSRITLFKDAGRLMSFWYRVKDFIGLRKRGWEVKDIISYCWEARYIRIYKRWGTEHKKSKTHFCFNPETASKCQGIVGQVRQREVKLVVLMPNLPVFDRNALDENDPIVQECMKTGYIDDFRVFKSLKRISPYIYANIISVSGGKRKMVLAIDSWGDRNPFTQKAQDLLSTYVKQISASFGI